MDPVASPVASDTLIRWALGALCRICRLQELLCLVGTAYRRVPLPDLEGESDGSHLGVEQSFETTRLPAAV